MGRTLGDEGEPNVVISERLRRRKFGGAGDVLGRTMNLTDFSNDFHTYTIVGVMPRGVPVSERPR